MNPLLQTVNRKNAGNGDPDWVGDLMGYRLWVIGHRGHRPRPLLRPQRDDRIHRRRAARWAGSQPARPTTSASAAAAATRTNGSLGPTPKRFTRSSRADASPGHRCDAAVSRIRPDDARRSARWRGGCAWRRLRPSGPGAAVGPPSHRPNVGSPRGRHRDPVTRGTSPGA